MIDQRGCIIRFIAGCLELTSRRQQARHLPTATVTPRPAIFIW